MADQAAGGLNADDQQKITRVEEDQKFRAHNPHDRVRVRRLITYEGPRYWVEKTLATSIQGPRMIGPGDAIIHGVTLDPFPVPIDNAVLLGREQVCDQILEILTPLEQTDDGDDPQAIARAIQRLVALASRGGTR